VSEFPIKFEKFQSFKNMQFEIIGKNIIFLITFEYVKGYEKFYWKNRLIRLSMRIFHFTITSALSHHLWQIHSTVKWYNEQKSISPKIVKIFPISTIKSFAIPFRT
jgi:hypothetical protein